MRESGLPVIIIINVLEFLRKIPKGKVVTYKQLAKRFKTSPRAIGRIMRANTSSAPCYKVVCSNEEIGGYRLGVRKKIKLLKADGIKVKNNKIDLKKYLFK